MVAEPEVDEEVIIDSALAFCFEYFTYQHGTGFRRHAEFIVARTPLQQGIARE